MLPAYAVEVGTEPLVRPARNSVGGRPFLDQAQDWPECFCGERLALFFQFDIPWDLEPFGGDHLLVFHCRAHNDASDPQLADGRLVPKYWDAPQPPYPAPFSYARCAQCGALGELVLEGGRLDLAMARAGDHVCEMQPGVNVPEVPDTVRRGS